MPTGQWAFPRRKPVQLADAALASVTQQGVWVLVGLTAAAGLGFGFWALAARLFPPETVGIAGSLISLSSFAAALAVLGLDAGLVRFAPRARHPRKLTRTILMVTGGLSLAIGVVVPPFVLGPANVPGGLWAPLIGLSLALSLWTVWSYVLNGAFLAAGKARLIAVELLASGVLKIAILLAFVSAGLVGLFAAYTLPVLLVVAVGFVALPRMFPAENPKGTAQSLREIGPLSAGNWIASFGYYLPNVAAPAIVLVFLGASTAAVFFIALQLAEILNFASESLARSLFAHGSREDRLARSLQARVRTRILLILVPLVVVGIVAAPSAASWIWGPRYGQHALLIQLFLLATLPKGAYQVFQARFNVDRRPYALVACGGTFGILTLGGLLIGLVAGLDPDLLPLAWIAGGIGVLAMGEYVAGRGARRSEGVAVAR